MHVHNEGILNYVYMHMGIAPHTACMEVNAACLVEFHGAILQVLQSHSRSDGYISDYCDATFFKSHEMFRKNNNELQLIMYFDEIEVCNPLGAQRGIHKLGITNCTVM